MTGREKDFVLRRDFLRAGGIAAAGFGLSAFLPRSAEALPKTPPRADIAFIPGCPELPLYKFNETRTVYPASLTKIMTVMLALEEIRKGNLSLSDTVEITREAREDTKKGGWNMPFESVTSITVEEALVLAMARSYNDVAYSIAQKISGLPQNQEKVLASGYVPGTEEAFVKAFMQPEAEKLGMHNTRFCNSHGLPPHDTNIVIVGKSDDYFNISTAADLAIMWDRMLTHYPEYRELLSPSRVLAPDGRTRLPHTALQVKNMVTSCRSLCSNIYADDVIGKTGTSNLGRNVAISVPRMVPACEGLVEVAVIAVGYPNAIRRNSAVNTLTNRVFQRMSADDLAERQAVIQARKAPPPLPALPIQTFTGFPHTEALQINFGEPALESRSLIERVLGVPLHDLEMNR